MRRYFREISVGAALVLLLVVLAFLGPAFFQLHPLLSFLAREAPELVVTCGIVFVIISRQIDISVGAQFGVCSVIAGMLAASGWPLAGVLVAGIVIGSILGAFNGLLIAGLRLPSIVVTLATMVILREGLRWKRQGQFVNLPDGMQWLGLTQVRGQLVIIITALALMAGLLWAMRSLAAGRFVYAVGSMLKRRDWREFDRNSRPSLYSRLPEPSQDSPRQ